MCDKPSGKTWAEIEHGLADDLRALCTPLGDERRCKLSKSSDVLLKMGKLYTEIAQESDGMVQKLSFIKSAALLHGARIRFKTELYNKAKCREVHRALAAMEKALKVALRAADSPDSNLFAFSWDIATRLQYLRAMEKQRVKNLEMINRSVLTPSELREKRMKKIREVKNIMKDNTENYLTLMQQIADWCAKLLPEKAPCDYALVGLGSLAREEITLYSDFEHVIVLQNGIESSLNYHNVKEYFRWYAVVFQIIIIGLGETFIRSIGVKSINDLYTDEKSKNWYFDVYTPSGVSFDGMVPHSCNHPLGRQEPTKNKKHIVELIQTASKMAEFLTSDQHMKNGYYLKDVLTRTCFVYGSPQVYTDFKRKSKKILSRESRKEVIAEQVNNLRKNVNKSVRRLRSTMPMGVDVKSSFYRPITALLAYWSKLRGMEEVTSFEIACKIESFCVDPFSRTSHFLQYAVAIACEVRLKAYILGGHQRQKLIGQEVGELVAIECAVECLSTILRVSETVDNLLPRQLQYQRAAFGETRGEYFYDALGYLDVKCFEKARLILEQKLEEYVERDDLYNAGIFYYLSIAIFYQAEISEDSTRVQLYAIAEKYLTKLLKVSPAVWCDLVVIDMLCPIYSLQGHNEKAKHTMDQWFKNASPEQYRDTGHNLLPMRMKQVSIMRLCLSPEELQSECMLSLNGDEDIYVRLSFQFGLAEAELAIRSARDHDDNFRNSVQDQRTKLTELVNMAMEEVVDIGRERILLYIEEIYGLQLRYKLWEDAYATLEVAELLLESRVGGQPREIGRIFENLCTVQCLLNVATFETNLEKQAKQALKAAQLCASLARQEDCKNYYIAALGLLKNYIVQNIPCSVEYIRKLGEFLSRAPNYVKQNDKLRKHLLDMTFRLFSYFIVEIEKGNAVVVRPSMIALAELFAEELAHPCLIRFVVLAHGLFPSESSVALTKDHSRNNFFDDHYFLSKSKGKAEFNKGLLHYFHWRTKESAEVLWCTLNKFQDQPSVVRKTCRMLLHVVLTHPYVPAEELLETDNFMERHCFPSRDGWKGIYNDTIFAFALSDFKTAAATFWMLAIAVEPGSLLQRRSVEMLLHSILLGLQLFYSLDLNFVKYKYIALTGVEKFEEPSHFTIYFNDRTL